MTTRAIIIGAPRSGSGKTSVTIGLLRAFARRGVNVRGIKTGPDYIDPGFHAFATGSAGLNLDSWAMQPDLLRYLFLEQAVGADLVIIESAMGLFDGIPVAEHRSGSAADLARLFGIPVLLVLDVSGQSQTAAAIAHGFAHYDPAVRMGAVVLNRAGSERHRTLCSEAIENIGLPLSVASCVILHLSCRNGIWDWFRPVNTRKSMPISNGWQTRWKSPSILMCCSRWPLLSRSHLAP